MGETMAGWVGHVADFTDFVAVAMILIGFVRGVSGWLRAEFGGREQRWNRIQGVRCTLGTYLLLGIEFMIISDILHSCVHRDFKSLGELGALVVIRTVISYFLASVDLMKVLARACGHDHLSKFSINDLSTYDEQMHKLTGVPWAGIS